MRRLLLGALLACALFVLSGCTGTDASLLPDLHLLDPIPYTEHPPEAEAAADAGAMQLDLWLDASQTMGGVNPNESSMYPHFSRKYREGGFHYRYGSTVGWYESMLRSMLSCAEGSRVRLLRFGNERLTDDFLLSHHLGTVGDADGLRSLRRDMLTWAIDPMPDAFSALSAEDMSGSFYALGTPALNRISHLRASLLENPQEASAMKKALKAQISGIEKGDDFLTAIGQDEDWPLLYALNNLDLSRLSVITFDPAGMRRLNAVAADGSPVALAAQALEERGVFDQGLSVHLLAFNMDYVGQLSSLGPADFSEPFLWGKLKYNAAKNTTIGVLPMPRTMLALVVGPKAQADSYVAALGQTLDSTAVFRELRGPAQDELTYAQNGETIIQQPFAFSWECMAVERPALPLRTQYDEDITLSSARRSGSLYTAQATSQDAFEETVTLPLSLLPEGVTASVSALTGVTVTVEDALLLSAAVRNRPGFAAQEGAQALALRDRLYLFERTLPDAQPFSVQARVQDGGIQFVISADAGLTPGYYRLCLSADYAMGAAEWDTPAWVEEKNLTITNEQVVLWEAFTGLMTRYDRDCDLVPRMFQHAWGPATDSTYHGAAYPDAPQVWQAPGLSELVRQIQLSANVERTPCLRFVFDVFVTR